MSDMTEPELLLDVDRILRTGELPEQADLKEILDDLREIRSPATREAARRLARLALTRLHFKRQRTGG
jgi:hypothetical protein